jgi:CRISPR-associated protein Csm1
MQQGPKTLNDIASAALKKKEDRKTRGLEALGILKADVDDLGLIMACGLRKNLYTISRMAALSRQMNNFFAMYLPWLLQTDSRFNNIYTVFAGGDDLLLIGPWDRIIELAKEIEKKFKAYVCHNKDIHFSAGITLHKPHTPVNVLARAAESALKEAKDKGKARVTIFDQTVTWKELGLLENIKNEIIQWLDDEWISRVFLYKINYFIEMVQTEKILLKER